jgi:hypothetical protein
MARLAAPSFQDGMGRLIVRSGFYQKHVPARIDRPMPGKMHADEVDTDPSLVSRLLADQFPQWADLPIEPVESSGTDNAIYRLGDDMAVRLPRVSGGTATIDKELRWLPELAPLLPVAISQPLAKGSPGQAYPWHWSVHRWLDGESVNVERMADPVGLGQDVGGFVAAMRRIDAAGGPIAGRDGSRGLPLVRRDAATREAIAQLDGVIDSAAVTAAWEAAVQAPTWQHPGGDRLWMHGRGRPGLRRDGRLDAVLGRGPGGVPVSPRHRRRHLGAGSRLGALVRADRLAVLHAYQSRVRARCPARDPRGAGGPCVIW